MFTSEKKLGFEFKSGTQVIARFNTSKNINLLLEVAITIDEKTIGLSSKTKLPVNYGMVFVLRPKERVDLWMKNTFIPLDLIFIDEGDVVNIVKNTVPNQTHTMYDSEVEVSEVIEVNAGFTEQNGIKIGDRVSFENIALFNN